MINNKKVVIIMPAYNAEKTLKQTYEEIYKPFVDEVILVDDNSQDNTKLVSKELNITTIVHKQNKGYGGNQKSCYKAASKAGADIVVMLHPDYQYTPKLIPAIVCMMAFGQYDAVLASRMLGNSALKGGMPLYKFVANKFLTWFENLFTGENLTEYHTGFRGFTREVLEEFGIIIKPIKKVYTYENKNSIEHFFLAEWIDGVFGSGQGEEFQENRNNGVYIPKLIEISDIPKIPLMPPEVASAFYNDYTKNGKNLRNNVKFVLGEIK